WNQHRVVALVPDGPQFRFPDQADTQAAYWNQPTVPAQTLCADPSLTPTPAECHRIALLSVLPELDRPRVQERALNVPQIGFRDGYCGHQAFRRLRRRTGRRMQRVGDFHRGGVKAAWPDEATA